MNWDNVKTTGRLEGRRQVEHLPTGLAALQIAARDQYGWPGGYEIVVITTDGGLICSKCVRTEYAQLYPSTRDLAGDGWEVVNLGSIGCTIDTSEPVYCDHCSRDLCEDY